MCIRKTVTTCYGYILIFVLSEKVTLLLVVVILSQRHPALRLAHSNIIFQMDPSAPNAITPLIHAVAGSVGGAVSLLLFYPLERARIEFQKSVSDAQFHNRSISYHQPLVYDASRSNKSSYDEFCGGEITLKGSRRGHVSRFRLMEEEPSTLGEPWSMAGNHEDVEDEETFVDAISYIGDDNECKTTLLNCLHKLWVNNELYHGVAPVVVTVAVSNFTFFFLHEQIKRFLWQRCSPATSQHGLSRIGYRSLLSSCLAGIGNVLLTNPLWVANLRLVTGDSSHKKSMLTEIVHVVRTKGWSHLWAGTDASLLLVSNPVLQFFVYEQLKRILLLRRSSAERQLSFTTNNTALGPIQAFLSGALAKTIATVCTYPLQLAQTLLRLPQHDVSLPTDPDKHTVHGTLDCLVQLYQSQGGVPALFTGLQVKLLQTVLTAAFTFVTYEQIVSALYNAHQYRSGKT